jgi:hypothetical protein
MQVGNTRAATSFLRRGIPTIMLLGFFCRNGSTPQCPICYRKYKQEAPALHRRWSQVATLSARQNSWLVRFLLCARVSQYSVDTLYWPDRKRCGATMACILVHRGLGLTRSKACFHSRMYILVRYARIQLAYWTMYCSRAMAIHWVCLACARGNFFL